MLNQLGNPQNLFLFSKMNLPLGNFILILLPYTFLSLILLFASIFFIPKRNLPRNIISSSNRNRDIKGAILFPILFVLCILCVLNIVPYWIVLPVVFAATAIHSAPLLLKADYMLLLTFCGFFIFTHNIAQIPEIKTALQNAVAGHEFWISIVASQVISNVPATLLLYPFSQNTKDLLLGVDIGGLGTLIASLASLISFKIYTNSSKSDKSSLAKYLGLFTLMNVLFLIAEIALFLLLQIKKWEGSASIRNEVSSDAEAAGMFVAGVRTWQSRPDRASPAPDITVNWSLLNLDRQIRLVKARWRLKTWLSRFSCW